MFFCVHIRCWPCFWKGFSVFFSLLAQFKILVRYAVFQTVLDTCTHELIFPNKTTTFPRHCGATWKVKTWHTSPCYHRYSPGPGEPWLQLTGALTCEILLKNEKYLFDSRNIPLNLDNWEILVYSLDMHYFVVSIKTQFDHDDYSWNYEYKTYMGHSLTTMKLYV